MRVNSVQNFMPIQKSVNVQDVVNPKKAFEHSDISFAGNLKSNEIARKLSKEVPNLLFYPGKKACDISFCGKNSKQENILVTGGAGYIGSHCAAYLLENGYNVVVVDNLTTGNIEAIDELRKIAEENSAKFDFYEVDISKEDEVAPILEEHDIDAAMHFAADSLVGESVKDPLKYYWNNTGKTANFLNTLHNHGVNKVIFSSTAATYGNPTDENGKPVDIITEETPQKPVNPYGWSKLFIEKMFDDADKAYDMRNVRLRYFNVAGARPDGRLGEAHFPETHLVPNILKIAAADGKKNKKGEVPTFKLFGDDYNTKDGTNVRDYIHVQDLARAHFLALQYLQQGGKTDYFNLGTGGGSSNRDVYNAACEATGKKIPLKVEGRREGDPDVLVTSGEKAKKVLGFEPEYKITQQIADAYSWIQNSNFANVGAFKKDI